MIKRSFNIPIYNFDVFFVEVEGKEDVTPLRRLLRKQGLSDEIEGEILSAVEEGSFDGGWTLSALGRRLFYVILLPMSSEESRVNVLNHEKRHIEDDLLEYCGVDDKEAAAYLAGYLSLKLR